MLWGYNYIKTCYCTCMISVSTLTMYMYVGTVPCTWIHWQSKLQCGWHCWWCPCECWPPSGGPRCTDHATRGTYTCRYMYMYNRQELINHVRSTHKLLYWGMHTGRIVAYMSVLAVHKPYKVYKIQHSKYAVYSWRSSKTCHVLVLWCKT